MFHKARPHFTYCFGARQIITRDSPLQHWKFRLARRLQTRWPLRKPPRSMFRSARFIVM